MSKIDLHIHSTFSPDADLSVTEIICICENKNMDTISITDHNSVGFYADFEKKKIKTNLNIIPGIELDCSYKGKHFHILGYDIDVLSGDFSAWEKEFTRRELIAVPERIRKLQQLGFVLSGDEVFEKADNPIPQEELMAELILENDDNKNNPLLTPYYPGGHRSDMPLINFYWDFMSHGKTANVPVEYLDIKDGISLIKDNGGIPILAHPGANFQEDIKTIDKVIKHGIQGLEVYSTYHNENQVKIFEQYANKGKIKITCGSDFHGKAKPLIEIGGINCYGNEYVIF